MQSSNSYWMWLDIVSQIGISALEVWFYEYVIIQLVLNMLWHSVVMMTFVAFIFISFCWWRQCVAVGQVRIEKKLVVRYGIVCLTSDVITVLGGVVESLYEEWQMNQKYAGFSRSSIKLGLDNDASGPPPFEKLQIGGTKSGYALNGILLLVSFYFSWSQP